MKIIVKIGTQALLSKRGTPGDMNLEMHQLSRLVEQIARLKKAGHQVLLVSSGAVATGRRFLQNKKEAWGKKAKSYNMQVSKQLLASVGQVELINSYAKILADYKLYPSQLLLSKQDFETRSHYLNIYRLLLYSLKEPNILPIINENDSVAIEELMFTDNDELAGLLALQLDVDLLILLTNVDGVFANPDTDSTVIRRLFLDSKWPSTAKTTSLAGRGGMFSKLQTAHKLAKNGIGTHIANASSENVLQRIIAHEELGTQIVPAYEHGANQAKPKLQNKGIKRWLISRLDSPVPGVVLKQEFCNLLKDKDNTRSILPVGITQILAEFDKGDIVNLQDPRGKFIGLGKARYASKKLQEYLGQQYKPMFMHYNYLIIE